MKKSYPLISTLIALLFLLSANVGFSQTDSDVVNNLKVYKLYSPHPNKCFKKIPEGPFSLEIKIKNTGKTTSKKTRVLLQYAPMDATNFKTMGSIEVPPIPEGKGVTLREDDLTYRLKPGGKYKVKAVLQYKDDNRKDNVGKALLTVVSRKEYNSSDCTEKDSTEQQP